MHHQLIGFFMAQISRGSNYQPESAPAPQQPAQSSRLSRIAVGGFAALALLGGGGAYYLNTAGKDQGVTHKLYSLTHPGAAQRRSETAVFDNFEPRYRVAADESCMHTLPSNRSLAEVCIEGGHYVYGKPVEPEKKGDRPEWLKSHVYFSDAGPNPIPLIVYFPLKDLRAAPVRPADPGASSPARELKH